MAQFTAFGTSGKSHFSPALALGLIFVAMSLWCPGQSAADQADDRKTTKTTEGREFLADPDKLKVLWTPYTWAFGMDSNLTVKGRSSEADVEFGDVLDSLDYGLTSYLELRKKRWFFTLDTAYLHLSADASGDARRGPLRLEADIDIELEEFIGEAAVGYTVLEHYFGGERADKGSRMLALDVLAGARYWYLNVKGDVDLDTTLGPLTTSRSRDFEKSKDWIDPIVGARIRAELMENLTFMLKGDVGGFGVGSDFTWSAQAVLDYRLSEHVSLYGGYRILDVDYEDGHGSDKFEFDANIKGPLLGFLFRF